MAVGSGGVIVFDGFQGNRTPHTDSSARGAVWGLSLGTSRAHMYRAVLEGVAYGTRAMVDTMVGATGGGGLARLTVVGGATRSPIFMQLLADVLGIGLAVPTSADSATLIGAAIVAVSSMHAADGDGGARGANGAGAASTGTAAGRGAAPSDPGPACSTDGGGGGGSGRARAVAEICRRWIRPAAVYEPSTRRHEQYAFFFEQYMATYARLRDGMHETVAHVQG